MSETAFPPEPSDAQIIEANRNAPEVSTDSVELRFGGSLVDIRKQGAYITGGVFISPSTGETVAILHSDPDISRAKISATHVMAPYGKNDGPGGQHGIWRWADYKQREKEAQRVALEAQQSDRGLSLLRTIELESDGLIITNTIHNTGGEEQHTSIGEHAYFNLTYGDFSNLRIDGQGIDELLGEGSMDVLADDGTLYYGLPDAGIVVQFPDDYKVHIEADFAGETKYPLALLMWQRQGTESICFEPVVGVDRDETNDGVVILPGGSASLRTKISIL